MASAVSHLMGAAQTADFLETTAHWVCPLIMPPILRAPHSHAIGVMIHREPWINKERVPLSVQSWVSPLPHSPRDYLVPRPPVAAFFPQLQKKSCEGRPGYERTRLVLVNMLGDSPVPESSNVIKPVHTHMYVH